MCNFALPQTPPEIQCEKTVTSFVVNSRILTRKYIYCQDLSIETHVVPKATVLCHSETPENVLTRITANILNLIWKFHCSSFGRRPSPLPSAHVPTTEHARKASALVAFRN